MKTFTIDDVEEKAQNKFFDEHAKCYRHSTAGGGYSTIFKPNAIGCVVIAKCDFCKEERNVTNFDKW